jgi:DNA polymerase-3 subunit alpha
MDSCTIEMDFGTDKTKKACSSSPDEDRRMLETLAMEGMRLRYGADNKKAADRIRSELNIINNQGFNSYFLITYDIVRYARSRGFYHVGRGSGANSIVAFCLHITDVDPLELDLYFERFLNPKRSVPPDFDLDFSWRDRDEVIEYIFQRYGHEHVCLLGSYTTFQHRAILRELGKVFGLPKEEIDQLERGTLRDDHIQRVIHNYALKLKDFPNHLSIHAGGMLISEKPVHYYTATELPPKGFLTSQIDMHVAEKVGLYKIDILSQRGLGHIRETIELVKKNQQVEVDISRVEDFKKDNRIAAQILDANTIGCFYIESPGMRQLLKKLKCDNYITLVAASSIIRPGVAQSGMMKQYIHRFHHPEEVSYLHPIMKELLEETYGVMVYQEDVIRVAHHFAGLDLAEADVLRRAMSGKYRGRKEFEKIREQYFLNCRQKRYPESVSKEVWRQIESFGGYSFSKAHSASFAVESYQSLFLKTYYPVEFMVAVINNFGGFYSRELYFHELKKTGARTHGPCVNHSDFHTNLTGVDVHMGLVHLQGLEEDLARSLVADRERQGNYQHLQDFIERLHPAIGQLNILIRIGAFRFTGKTKKELLWEANFLQKRQASAAGSRQLFPTKQMRFSLPALTTHPLDDAIDEIELLGFPIDNPFRIVDADPYAYQKAADLPARLNAQVTVLAYLITTKTTRTVRNELMYFGTFIDVNGEWIDTVHFPDTQNRYPLEGKGFYLMKGKVVEDFGVYSVEVSSCRKIGIKDRTAPANSIVSDALLSPFAGPVLPQTISTQ